MEWIANIVALYPLSSSKPAEKKIVPVSVNYFPHRRVRPHCYFLHTFDARNRQCNYACNFCFHTTKNLDILPLDEAKRGLRLLADAGMKKLNISGGEPFLKPAFIGEVFRFCKEELGLESCSVVNNGSKVTEKWLDTYGKYLDVMAISCDSFDAETNKKIGRTDQAKKGDHVHRVFEVAEWCRRRGIKVKINSVINAHNWQEDMNEHIAALSPARWKVFQVLLLEGENTGERSLRDARQLVISKEQFQSFLDRHAGQESLVPEDNEAMKDSYLNLDENMRQVQQGHGLQLHTDSKEHRFLNCETGGKVPGRSLLEVGVQEALKDAGWNEQAFVDRGGIFEWSRSKDEEESLEW